MEKILIIEDDLVIGNLIEEILKDTKYHTIRASSGNEALVLFQQNKPSVVLLDLMLPGIPGEELIENFKNKTKIIILSAKTGKNDKINNLLRGADDYITKPFDSDELLARIEVQLRHQNSLNQKEITLGEITINNETYQAFVNEKELKLTKSEFAILSLLMSRPNYVFSRSVIFETIFNSDAIGDEETIKVHISNLRSKLKEFSEKKYIETVWGVGFKFFPNS